MAPERDLRKSRKVVRRAQKTAAFGVHLLTASGAAIALLALVAAIAGNWTLMFVWLGAALIVDGIDGALARRINVAERLPRWSGEVLDLVVDYLNYVLVPAIAIATGSILPEPFALPAAAAILISSVIYYADSRMKTDDAYFRGFPALWNVVAFYLFIVRPDPNIALAVVGTFVILTFIPIHFIHPLRVKKWVVLNVALLALWSILGFIALAYQLAPPGAVVVGLLLIALYFLAVGLTRPRRLST